MSKQILVDSIMQFLVDNELTGDVYIYANNNRYHVDENSKITIKENIKPSEVSEYMHDEFVCITFEGKFYDIINYPSCKSDYDIINNFEFMLEALGYYSELGNAWNLNIVPLR